MRLFLLSLVACLVWSAAPASASHDTSNFNRMDLLFASPNATGATNSDLAFWGDRAYAGNYDGIRIFDISDPDEPVLVKDFRCFGPQNDLSVWDRNRDGKADLLITSVDRTLSGPQCGAAAVAHDTPRSEGAWEGLRIFRLNGDDITQIGAVYQDCGSHTHTGYRWRSGVRILNSSYPLRPGPTCGPVRGPEAGRDPAHGVIQVVQVPFSSPGEDSKEIAELPITYRTDPANPDCEPVACEANAYYPISERGFNVAGLVEPMRACHDMTVFVPQRLVGAACAEEVQLWRLGRDGLPDTGNPLWTYDQHNVDFWHSATFSWDGKVVNAIDESFGSGCPTTTELPPWNRRGDDAPVESGNMFFLRRSDGAKLSEFRMPRAETFEHSAAGGDDGRVYCSAHLGNTVPMPGRNLLVNAWYTAGADVIDFTDPSNPHEIAYYDVEGDNWSAYWYEHGHKSPHQGFPIYASHGVENSPGQGFQAFRANIRGRTVYFNHLNPQTMERVIRGPRGAARRAAARRAKSSVEAAGTAAQRTGGAGNRGAGHLAP